MIWDWAICGKAVQSQDERDPRVLWRKEGCLHHEALKQERRNLSLHPPAATTYLDSTSSPKEPLMRANASERTRCSTATNTGLGTLHAGTQEVT